MPGSIVPIATGQTIDPAGDVVAKESALLVGEPPPMSGMVVEVPDELPELGIAGIVDVVDPDMAGIAPAGDDEDPIIGVMVLDEPLGVPDSPIVAIGPP